MNLHKWITGLHNWFMELHKWTEELRDYLRSGIDVSFATPLINEIELWFIIMGLVYSESWNSSSIYDYEFTNMTKAVCNFVNLSFEIRSDHLKSVNQIL